MVALLETYAKRVADAVDHVLYRLDPHSEAPLFLFATDPLLNDGFGLTALSPCIDAGLTLAAVGNDYFGNPRIPPHDIGAVEYRP